MKETLQSIYVGICLLTPVAAQPPQVQLDRDTRLETLRFELMLRELQDNRAQVEREIAERRQAQYREQQFIGKMNRFVILWKALAEEYNEKSAFNIKLATQVSDAFRDLECTEGWPKKTRK
jgi:hypothetical protein